MDYPFTLRCTHPITFRTIYGETVEVPCRRCAACINSKASRISLLCNLEAQQHKFCYFVTLTFDRHNVPMIPYDYDYESQTITFFSKDTGEVLFSLPLSRKEYKVILQKFAKSSYFPEGYFPFNEPRYFQLFMKRLRKQLSKYSDEKIRYFCVSEYGPQTLRPHFHVLLFFDTPQLSQVLRQSLYKAWTLGTVDVSLSRGHCASYVSSYVNSIVCLPSLFTSQPFKTFTLKSRFFGFRDLVHVADEIRSAPLSEFFEKRITIDDRSFPLYSFPAIKRTLFPKCVGYGHHDSQFIRVLYTVYDTFSQFLHNGNVNYISQCILDFFRDGTHVTFLKHPDLYSFLTWFSKEFIHSDLWYINSEQYDHVLERLSSILYTSKHFCCNLCSCNPLFYSHYIDKIYEFYDTVESQALYSQYTKIEDYFANNPYSDSVFALWFSFDEDTASNLQSVKDYEANQYELLTNRIKHKAFNDIYMFND